MCQVSYFKSNEVGLLFPFEEIVNNHVFSFGNMDVDEGDFKGDFEQTIVLVGMDVDEAQIEVQ